MCGICGVVSPYQELPLKEEELIAMRDSLLHRGPDDAGYHLAPGIALASRRLAILDLSSKGRMPMSTKDGRYQIVYNGEIYNFESLSNELRKQGISLHSKTDTEVLLNLFALEGASMLNRLNGMFAFGIWDHQERRLFLARDRLGVKPLYYYTHENKLYFASEEKAFFAAGLPAQFEASVFEELLYFHYVAGGQTPYQGIKRLLPGHYLTWHQGKTQLTRWWNLSEKVSHIREEVLQNPSEWFQKTFDDAVKIRRISDVPVGVFLSGGLDSGSVAASMALQNQGPVSSFTVRFNEKSYDEGPLAKLVGDQYCLNQHELQISLQEIPNYLNQVTHFLDEPLVHASDIHLWKLAQFAKSKVTVLLSGEGADETMAGYGWFQRYRFLTVLKNFHFLFWIFQKMHPSFKQMHRILSLNRSKQMLLRNVSETMQLSAFGFSPLRGPFAFRESILHEAEKIYPYELVRQAMYYDQHTYLCSILDRNDRMTMAASIECRTPFLDYRLVEAIAALPSKELFHGLQNKWLLRKSIGKRLPAQILKSQKRGFDVPWSSYMSENKELRERILNLPEHPFWKYTELNKPRMTQCIKKFLEGNHTDAFALRHLLAITLWYDTCIQSKSRRRIS